MKVPDVIEQALGRIEAAARGEDGADIPTECALVRERVAQLARERCDAMRLLRRVRPALASKQVIAEPDDFLRVPTLDLACKGCGNLHCRYCRDDAVTR